MSAQIDSRRIRMWGTQGETSDPVRVIMRYGLVRLWGSWPGILLTVLATIYVVMVLGFYTYALPGGSANDYQVWVGGLSAFIFPTAVILVMVGGPLFAEDIRFNAPLFYFSKPLKPRDYFVGKAGFLAALVVLVSVAPVLLGMLMTLVIGIPATHFNSDFYARYYDPADIPSLREDFFISHIDTVPEWFIALGITLPAFLLLTAFLVGATVVTSAYAKRGWQASMGLAIIVIGLSMLSTAAFENSEAPILHLAGPVGWSYLMIGLPMSMVFDPYVVKGEYGMFTDTSYAVDQAWFLIPVCYVLVAGLTVMCFWLARRRLQRMEAML